MALLLDALTWPNVDGNPITIGGRNADLFLDDDGVEGLGQPTFRTEMSDRHGGGAHGGSQVANSGVIRATCWAQRDDEAEWGWEQLFRLHAAMNERPDPTDVLRLGWRGLMWRPDQDLMRWARPLRCEWVTVEDAVLGGIAGLDLSWTNEDPVTYSYDPETYAFTAAGNPKSIPVTNPGSKASRGGSSYTVSVYATSTMVSPYIQVGDRRVTWVGLTLAAGQTLVVDRHRQSWVGLQGVDGYTLRGANPFPDWPILPPGDSTFTVGGASGACTGEIKVRGTW